MEICRECCDERNCEWLQVPISVQFQTRAKLENDLAHCVGQRIDLHVTDQDIMYNIPVGFEKASARLNSLEIQMS